LSGEAAANPAGRPAGLLANVVVEAAKLTKAEKRCR
jgi:hypothetical protein